MIDGKDLYEEFITDRFSRAFDDNYDELRYHSEGMTDYIVIAKVEFGEVAISHGNFTGDGPAVLLSWLETNLNEGRVNTCTVEESFDFSKVHYIEKSDQLTRLFEEFEKGVK